MEEQEKHDAEQPGQEDRMSICPCCGKPTLPYPVQKIPDELLDQFMACMISGQPFTHTYDMYDGRIKVTVAQLTPEARSDITLCLQAIDSLDDHKAMPDGVHADNLRGYVRTLISVQRIVIKAGSSERTYTPEQGVRGFAKALQGIQINDTERLAAVVSEWYRTLTSVEQASAMPPAQLLAAVEAHARLLDIMFDAGFGPSFWRGIELV